MENYNYLSKDLITLEGIEEMRKNNWNKYDYNKTGVPRVTNIIKQCRDQSALISWASKVGFKADDYRDKALTIGTITHECVDEYLRAKYINHVNFNLNLSNVDSIYRDSVFIAFNNFINWENRLNLYGGKIDEVIGIEVPVSCPWFGGTIDAIMRINNAVYIIDFKTSKFISEEYLLQTAAYMWCVNNYYEEYMIPKIDGIGIIRLDKSKQCVDDLFLNAFIPEQLNIIDNYYKCFASYVESHYRTLSTDYITGSYKNKYDNNKGIKNILN